MAARRLDRGTISNQPDDDDKGGRTALIGDRLGDEEEGPETGATKTLDEAERSAPKQKVLSPSGVGNWVANPARSEEVFGAWKESGWG